MTDKPLFYTRLHYIVLLWPTCFMAASIALVFYFPVVKIIAIMIFVVGAIGFITIYSALSFSSFAIYPKSIAIQSGILTRQSVTLPISKIETVEVTQTILGAILNFGTIVLIGTGGTRNVFVNLSKPLTCRRHIERLVNYAEE